MYTYTLWISLPDYPFGMNSLAMDIRRFLKRPSSAFTHTDAHKVRLKKINSHFKMLFWFEQHRIKRGTNTFINVLSNTTMQVTSKPSLFHLNRPNKTYFSNRRCMSNYPHAYRCRYSYFLENCRYILCKPVRHS